VDYNPSPKVNLSYAINFGALFGANLVGRWATWLLAQYPEAQAKMQTEIDAVLGDRMPTYDDMKSLEQVPLRQNEIVYRLFH